MQKLGADGSHVVSVRISAEQYETLQKAMVAYSVKIGRPARQGETVKTILDEWCKEQLNHAQGL